MYIRNLRPHVLCVKYWLIEDGVQDLKYRFLPCVLSVRYALIEEGMEDLDPEEGLYIYHGHTLRLTGQDR